MSANASIYVGQEAFRNCVTLSDITARIAAVDDGAFRNCISLRAITFVSSGIEYIGSNAFNGCVLIQKVSIPSSVVAIGDSAFDGCRGITSLTFESDETLQTIGYSAFGGCSLLTRVILPSSLVELNATVFYGCSDLEYVGIRRKYSDCRRGRFRSLRDRSRSKIYRQDRSRLHGRHLHRNRRSEDQRKTGLQKPLSRRYSAPSTRSSNTPLNRN